MSKIDEIAARLNDRHDNASWIDIAFLLEEVKRLEVDNGAMRLELELRRGISHQRQ